MIKCKVDRDAGKIKHGAKGKRHQYKGAEGLCQRRENQSFSTAFDFPPDKLRSNHNAVEHVFKCRSHLYC